MPRKKLTMADKRQGTVIWDWNRGSVDISWIDRGSGQLVIGCFSQPYGKPHVTPPNEAEQATVKIDHWDENESVYLKWIDEETGETVVAEFDQGGWAKAPPHIRAQINRRLSKPPQAIYYGSPRRGPRSC